MGLENSGLYIQKDIHCTSVKDIEFLGSSLKELQQFPEGARRKAGFQLRRIQLGLEAEDSKPMQAVGAGVQELRIWDTDGTFRIIYAARFADAVYVLHAFEKKTQATSQRDIELARARYKFLLRRPIQS
jgi:phage-related protein